MMLSGLISVALLASLCDGEYYRVIGEDFNNYIRDSGFHVESHADVNMYGIPAPPGGNKAVYLTDVTLLTQSPIFHIPSTQLVHFQFTFYCDDSPSELRIQLSYPRQGEQIVLCGENSAIAIPGQWVTETFTRECYSTCDHIDIWLYGGTIEVGNIVGIHAIAITTEESTFAPTEITQSTTTSHTTTMPTTTTPTTTMPACLSPGSSCSSGHGTCKTSCDSNEYSNGTCGGASCTCCKLGWPAGKYSLPKPSAGCPNNDKFTWGEGWSTEDTENGDDLDASYMAATSGSHYVTKRYCTKTGGGGVGSWPVGNYCIYRYGGSCPSGFNAGSINWEDRDLHGSNSHSGNVPDGSMGTSETKIEYCCRSDGSGMLHFPTEHPFLLLANEHHDGYVYCPLVSGMIVKFQHIRVDTENTDDDSSSSGDIPVTCGSCCGQGCFTYGIGYTRDPLVYYCHYS